MCSTKHLLQFFQMWTSSLNAGCDMLEGNISDITVANAVTYTTSSLLNQTTKKKHKSIISQTHFSQPFYDAMYK